MGNSCELEFFSRRGDCSMYGFDRDDEGRIVYRVLCLAQSHNPKLSSIIHEINECEVTDLITKILMEDLGLNFDYAYYTLTADMIHKNPNIWLHKRGHSGVNSKIWVSHVISPYGCCNCFMPRSETRIKW